MDITMAQGKYSINIPPLNMITITIVYIVYQLFLRFLLAAQLAPQPHVPFRTGAVQAADLPVPSGAAAPGAAVARAAYGAPLRFVSDYLFDCNLEDVMKLYFLYDIWYMIYDIIS